MKKYWRNTEGGNYLISCQDLGKGQINNHPQNLNMVAINLDGPYMTRKALRREGGK